MNLLNKLSTLIKAVPHAPTELIKVLVKDTTEELCGKLIDNDPNPVPDEVFDYFKTLKPEIKIFIVNSMLYSMVDMSKQIRGRTDEELETELIDLVGKFKEKTRAQQAPKKEEKQEQPQITEELGKLYHL